MAMMQVGQMVVVVRDGVVLVGVRMFLSRFTGVVMVMVPIVMIVGVFMNRHFMKMVMLMLLIHQK